MYIKPLLTSFTPRNPHKLFVIDVVTGEEFCEVTNESAINTMRASTKQASAIIDGLGKVYAITKYNYQRDAYVWEQLEQLP